MKNKKIMRLLTLLLTIGITAAVLFRGGNMVKAFDIDYVINPDDPNLALVHTYTGVKYNSPRLTNDVIYYSYEENPTGPGTNQYGYEAACNPQGFIIEKATRVSMPNGGFIISVHGDKVGVLRDTVKVGDIVTYDEASSTVKIYHHNVYSVVAGATVFMEEAQKSYEEAKAQMYDFDDAAVQAKLQEMSSKIAEMESYNQDGDLTTMEKIKLNSALGVVEDMGLQVKYMTMPYRKVEAVAMWHRPTVATLTLNGVLYFLNKIKKAGVNLLLVETLWDSYAVYESDILETKSEMVITGNNVFGEYGNDYLKCLITEAHKLGIEVHAWSQTFRAGTSVTNSVNDIPKHLKPEWVQKGYQGRYGFDDLGLMYLDPANPEVLTHLKAVYNEMLDKYDWDGVELDYIRYPYSNLVNYASNSDTSTLRDGGYTAYAENDFLASINKSGSDLKTLIRTDSRTREQWSNYRVAKVNNVVKELAQVIREHNPDLDVSMAVAADHVGGRMNYMCDWMSWINNGWIDTFRPMAYTGDVDAITTFTERYVGLAHQLSFLQMGIGPGYEGFPAIVNQLQMDTVMKNGGTGCAIFASQNLYNVPEAEEAMALNTNRYGKVAPFGDFRTVLKESMNYLEDKMDRIYSTASDFTEGENLRQIIERVKGVTINSPSDFKKVNDELNILKAYAGLIKNNVIRVRIMEDVNYLVSLLDIKINRSLINYGFWDGKGTRPDISQFEFPAFAKLPEENGSDGEKKGCFGCQSGTGMMMSFFGALTLMGLLFRKRNE